MIVCDFCGARNGAVSVGRVEYLLQHGKSVIDADNGGIIDADSADLCRPCYMAMRDRIRNVLRPEKK